MNRIKPLERIRVVDFSRLAPGPYCSLLLAEMGALVTRIVRPGEVQPLGDVLGRGKQTVEIDLKDTHGLQEARALIEQSDVLLEGFRPGVMERLGLGPADCSPRLVYARLTGWGQDGPMAQRAGHDLNYIALSGVLAMCGNQFPRNLLADFAGGGLSCAFGIVCALLERERTGRGTIVDSAMAEGAAHLASFFAADRTSLAVDGSAPFYRVYRTSDDKFVSVAAIEPQFWDALCTVLAIDPAGQHDRGTWPTRHAEIEAIFAVRTRAEWTEAFAGIDACVAPVLDPDEAIRDPHMTARGAFVTDENGVTRPSPAPRLLAQ